MTQIEASSRLNNLLNGNGNTNSSDLVPHHTRPLKTSSTKSQTPPFAANTKLNEYINNYYNDTSNDKQDADDCEEIDIDSRTRTQSIKNVQNSDLSDVKVQVYYCGIIMVVYIKHDLKLDELIDLLRDICKFDKQQLFTIKWVDEEGDPCTLSSQVELDEALRLYYLNKESELIVHIFANIPERPGTQCAGEDRSIYRRGARRWRKIYLVNGHKYQAKRFARTALCKVCQDRIWGLGRSGYKCLDCKIMVHKRCHKFISLQCSEILNQQQQQQLSSYLSTTSTQSSIGNGSAQAWVIKIYNLIIFS